jgi:hypothetical protein
MRFVIIASPRTGSSHLTKLLDQQDEIICNGEIFHPRKVYVNWPKADKSKEVLEQLAELRGRDPRAFLDRIYGRNYGRAHVGFKIFSGHNNDILDELIEDASILKIVLLRRNILASYSSSLIAQKTGKHSSRSPPTEQPVVEFNPTKFIAYTKRLTTFYRSVFERLNDKRQHFYVVHYEQVNDPWFFASLVSFIGGDSARVVRTGGAKKLNSSTILSRFSNPEAVEDFLCPRGLMSWIYESPVSLDPFGSAGVKAVGNEN